MKLVVTLFALIGLSFTAPPLSLESDIIDFLELIPLEDIKTIVDKHVRNDKEFQAAILYIQGDEFANILENLDKTNQAKAIKEYFSNAGIDLDFIGMILQEIIGDIDIKSHYNKKSVKKFLQEVNSIIPHEELLKLYMEKMDKSTFFQEFIDKLTSERFHKLVEDILATDEAQQFLDSLESIEVEIRKFLKGVYAFIGWRESNSL